MAELKVNNSENSDVPSNDQIVNSLVKEIGNVQIISDENQRDCNTTATNTNDHPSKSTEKCDNSNTENFVETEDEEKKDLEDDFIDEDYLKDLEIDYTEEDRQRLKGDTEQLKISGNSNFKAGEYKEAAFNYTKALRLCPLAFSKDRAVLYANRAAAKVKLHFKEAAVDDCSKAVELDPEYLKAYLRRAQLYEQTDKLDEALADYKKIIEIDPSHQEAIFAAQRLPDQINERNEKMKTEMLGKLKDLGNMILKPFGLSTNNFQMVQDPNSGGYSISLNQNPSNNS